MRNASTEITLTYPGQIIYILYIGKIETTGITIETDHTQEEKRTIITDPGKVIRHKIGVPIRKKTGVAKSEKHL